MAALLHGGLVKLAQALMYSQVGEKTRKEKNDKGRLKQARHCSNSLKGTQDRMHQALEGTST